MKLYSKTSHQVSERADVGVEPLSLSQARWQHIITTTAAVYLRNTQSHQQFTSNLWKIPLSPVWSLQQSSLRRNMWLGTRNVISHRFNGQSQMNGWKNENFVLFCQFPKSLESWNLSDVPSASFRDIYPISSFEGLFTGLGWSCY